MKLLAKFVHGSHLYKLNTAYSDTDYKAVYMPPLEDMLLGKINHSSSLGTNKSNEKNSKEDIDFEVYSIHKWLSMLVKQDMVGFDMLFAPHDCVVYYDKQGVEITDDDLLKENPVWWVREVYRDMFLSSEMKGYLGYVNKQAAKYGVKGSRLDTLFVIKDVLSENECFDKDSRLESIKDLLPDTNHSSKSEDHYEVLGKKHQWSTHLSMFVDRIDSEIEKYGHRARLAQKNEGVDWKAVSHAIRSGYQLISLFETGFMSVVLPEHERDLIIQVKLGELDWESEVKPLIETLMDKVEVVCEENKAGLPDEVDEKELENALLSLIFHYYGIDN